MRSERIHRLNALSILSGEYVLYRMQASVRVNDNLALVYAIERANELRLPLLVVFVVNSDYPEANYRHFSFLFEGLRCVESRLCSSGISFMLLEGRVEDVLPPIINKAALVVLDKGYLKIQREWSRWIAQNSISSVVEVEDNLIVPICSASSKAEWAARTIRTKLMSRLDYFRNDYVVSIPEISIKQNSFSKYIESNRHVEESTLSYLRGCKYLSVGSFIGGEDEANRMLSNFLELKFSSYNNRRNDPSMQATTRLSPYLHFGHISPLTIVRAVDSYLVDSKGDISLADVFLEELIVRRELAHNFVYFTPDYDSFSAIPGWAQKTLVQHQSDPRVYDYSVDQLIACATHDRCWNASMRELIETGYMENTMRMYWGKKIIEWTSTPQEAYRICLRLNNQYQLDGRDANSFVGVGWCFGLHDRPWKERSIFGMVRYMGEEGLRRKYDMEAYIRRFL